jgi:2-polyprenyl-3-methyl-5-hydroxy-6-metoxy-1,4-benzoquinol methylase
MFNFIGFIFQSPIIYQLNQWLWVGDFLSKIPELKKVRSEEKILDIACGTSNISKYIAGQYIGIDINQYYLNYAKKHYPDNKYIYQDYKTLNFISKYFDQTFVSNFLHHLSNKEVEILLDKINYWTKNEIIIADVVPNNKNFLARLLYKLDQGKFFRCQKDQEKIISQSLKIEKVYTFLSPRKIYKHIVFVCSPRN